METPILYGEKLLEILQHFGIDADDLPDKLYGTMLKSIYDCMEGNPDLKTIIGTTGCIAFPYSVADSFDSVLNEENTAGLVSTHRAFEGCTNLVNAPMIDTSGVTNAMYMFYGCTALQTVPAYDFGGIEGAFGNAMFYNCTSLKSMLATGIKFDLDLSASTEFEAEDLVTIMTNLETVEETKTLTLGETNLAKLTDEQKEIATDKGWTLN